MAVRRSEPGTRDIALGTVVAGARAGRAARRAALLPVLLAARTPVVGVVLRRTATALAADGRVVRAAGRRRTEAAASDLLLAPEIARTVDRALAGPLTDAVARSVAEHHVVERIAADVLANADFERAVAAALENERTVKSVERAVASPSVERLVTELLESRLTVELTNRVLASPELERTVARLAASPEVRAALGQQTLTLLDETAAAVRRRAERLDHAVERRVRGLLGRPAEAAAAGARASYGGLAARGGAFAVDIGIAALIALAGAGLLALVTSLVGELRPAWLLGLVVAFGWLVVAGSYFVVFWTSVGQTPGMRGMRLRVTDARGEPPGLGRSLLRFGGLVLAIVPMFAGFLPALVDDRRRALPDYIAGTTVRTVDGGEERPGRR
jgi:uncharacterized RDD family membrane protein YckC